MAAVHGNYGCRHNRQRHENQKCDEPGFAFFRVMSSDGHDMRLHRLQARNAAAPNSFRQGIFWNQPPYRGEAWPLTVTP